jgi:hypothetical protein
MATRGEGQTAPPRPEQRERRFRIVKLEERIAPGGGNGNGSNAFCHYHYYSSKKCRF